MKQGLLLFALVATVSAASAGEALRLKGGVYRLDGQSIQTMNQALADEDADAIRYFVIQFEDAIRAEDRAAIDSAGLVIQDYLPEDAYLVRGTLAQANEASASSSRIRAAVPFRQEWKLSPALLDAFKERDPSFLVTVGRAETPLAIARRIRSLPGVRSVASNGADDLVVRAPQSVLSSLARIEGVLWIEPVPMVVTMEFRPFDDAPAPNPLASPPPPMVFTGFESGTRVMGFDAAWERGFKGQGQIAAMADTGVDTGNLSTLHSDLASVFKGYPVGFGGRTWDDPQAHGTHVAGSVIGNGARSEGKIQGGAHEAKMIAAGLWSPILNNLAFPQDFTKIIGPAFADGARVHTNSWGNPSALGSYDSLASKIDDYMWNNPDILVLFAAGNGGEDKDRDGRIDEGSVTSPATAKNVLTVGASENTVTGGMQAKHSTLRDGTVKWGVEPIASDTLSNNADGIAVFSSRGPTDDGRLKPEIVAPGTNIVSARSHHPKAGLLWGEFGTEYLWSGGTSMATPLTAGAATVVREFLVKQGAVANPSAALVKATLIHTATDMYPGQYGTGPKQELPTRRPNVHEGYGRVNMDAATSLDADHVRIADERGGVGVGESKQATVEVSSGGTLRATLAYTDAPGATTAAKALVNDLDLKVTGPNGFVKELKDRKNNTEMVELSGLAPGEYVVSVTGVNVPQGRSGKQPYALVVSF